MKYNTNLRFFVVIVLPISICEKDVYPILEIQIEFEIPLPN